MSVDLTPKPVAYVGEFSSVANAVVHCEQVNKDEAVAVALVNVGVGSADGRDPYSSRTWQAGSRLILVRCGLCRNFDLLPFPDAVPVGSAWHGGRWIVTSTAPFHMDPSVVLQVGEPSDILQRCHYFIHNGRFEPLGDSQPWRSRDDR